MQQDYPLVIITNIYKCDMNSEVLYNRSASACQIRHPTVRAVVCAAIMGGGGAGTISRLRCAPASAAAAARAPRGDMTVAGLSTQLC